MLFRVFLSVIPASRQNNEIILFFKGILKMTETALINDVISMSFQRYQDDGQVRQGLSLMPFQCIQ